MAGASVRKLIESTFVTLDGVIGAPQDWGPPYWDDQHGSYADKLLSSADSLLLGRETYEGFAQAWPGRGGDYADRINDMPKHVASRTLTETTWNATLLDGNAAEAVAELKGQAGKNILKFGTGELDRALMKDQLVDEFHFWVFPVVAGGGQRLLDGVDITHLELLDAVSFNSGIVVHVCGPKR